MRFESMAAPSTCPTVRSLRYQFPRRVNSRVVESQFVVFSVIQPHRRGLDLGSVLLLGAFGGVAFSTSEGGRSVKRENGVENPTGGTGVGTRADSSKRHREPGVDRFTVPLLPEGLLQRSRLLERLDVGVSGLDCCLHRWTLAKNRNGIGRTRPRSMRRDVADQRPTHARVVEYPDRGGHRARRGPCHARPLDV